MSNSNLIKIIESFPGKRIGTVGDVMLDGKMIVKTRERSAPDDHSVRVLIADSNGESDDALSYLGGASNVANGVSKMGGASF